MASMKYFAYGSNLDPAQMKKRVPQHQAIGVARAPGYRLAFTKRSSGWGGYVADLLPDEASQVWGMVYELQASDVSNLDHLEGGYKRRPITVYTGDSLAQQAEAYFVVQKEGEGAPSERYLQVIIKGARHWGLPRDYISSLVELGAKSPRGSRGSPLVDENK